MNCTYEGCTKAWNAGEAEPNCPVLFCPLRAEYHRSMHPTPSASGRIVVAEPREDKKIHAVNRIKQSANVIRSRIEERPGQRFQPYTMTQPGKKGKKSVQSATTKVILKSGEEKRFKTRPDNMHSEMYAVEWMIEQGHWDLFLDQVAWADGTPITAGEFSTGEPHCGFCTIMLEILGLPLTKPTKGNYNLACNYNYPVPKFIKEDVTVLTSLIEGKHVGYHNLKKLLNDFINLKPDEWVLAINPFDAVDDVFFVPISQVGTRKVIDWRDFVTNKNGTILDAIWKLVWRSIYETNQ